MVQDKHNVDAASTAPYRGQFDPPISPDLFLKRS